MNDYIIYPNYISNYTLKKFNKTREEYAQEYNAHHKEKIALKKKEQKNLANGTTYAMFELLLLADQNLLGEEERIAKLERMIKFYPCELDDDLDDLDLIRAYSR